MPTADKSMGNKTPSTFPAYITAPRVIAEIIEPTYDSNKSAPIPATSPTLSPTLSAITAGFLGSSSGMPASTFPTRSAPTSAAFVYIPPPTRANKAIELAPRPKPVTILASLINIYKIPKPRRPKPTTHMPITAPPLNAIPRASFWPLCAAFAVLAFAFVATCIPK